MYSNGNNGNTLRSAITVIVQHKKNRQLLVRLLREWNYKVQEDQSPEKYPQTELFVMDGISLERYEKSIRKLREGTNIFLPVLLVTPRENVKYITADLFNIADELVLIPIEKRELQARIHILLRARQYSQKAEERYFTLAEKNPVGLLVIQDEKIVYANPRIFTRTHYSKKELYAKKFLELIHPDERKKCQSYYQNVLSGKTASRYVECQYQTRDGFRWAQVYTAPFELYGQKSVLVIIHDITERRQHEEKIIHLNRMLEAIRGINQLIIKIDDRDTLIEKASQRLVKFRDYRCVWIALYDRNKEFLTAAQAQMEGD